MRLGYVNCITANMALIKETAEPARNPRPRTIVPENKKSELCVFFAVTPNGI